MDKSHKEHISDLETMAEQIDYTAVVARMAGELLTQAQKESCAEYDALYDLTHSRKKKDER